MKIILICSFAFLFCNVEMISQNNLNPLPKRAVQTKGGNFGNGACQNVASVNFLINYEADETSNDCEEIFVVVNGNSEDLNSEIYYVDGPLDFKPNETSIGYDNIVLNIPECMSGQINGYQNVDIVISLAQIINGEYYPYDSESSSENCNYFPFESFDQNSFSATVYRKICCEHFSDQDWDLNDIGESGDAPLNSFEDPFQFSINHIENRLTIENKTGLSPQNIEIYDLYGNILFSGNPVSDLLSFPTSQMNGNLLIVRVESDEQIFIRKIFM